MKFGVSVRSAIADAPRVLANVFPVL